MLLRLIGAICLLFFSTAISANEKETQETLSPSTPEQIAALTCEPDYLVGGVISPLSGQPILRIMDLHIKGAQDIVLTRIYIPPYIPSSFPKYKQDQEEHNKKHLFLHLRDTYKGWKFYPHLRLELNPASMEVRLSEPNGMTLGFYLSGLNYSITTIASPLYAISNTVGDIPSSKYDPRNTRISYEENGNRIVVYSPDGIVRTYLKKGTTKISLVYLLDKERLANGKILKYSYDHRFQLEKIESLDPKEQHVYASCKVSGTPWEGRRHFSSSSGKTVDYNYQSHSIHWKFKEKNKGAKYEEEGHELCPPVLKTVSSPYYRNESLDYTDLFLLKSYSGKEEIFSLTTKDFGTKDHYLRTHQLLLPVGKNDSEVPVYEFSYHPPVPGESKGTTTIKNSDGITLVYHFSENLLPTAIQYFGQDGRLQKEKILSWDENNWLTALEMRDGQKNLLYQKSFNYDRFGNPILETFTGDLTGGGNQETFITKRTFSENRRHLLLREETEDGKVVCFSYLPGTDLITTKLTKDGDQIILRDFSVYDDCNNLVQTISDDGNTEDRNNLSHVTQRKLKTYTLRKSAPFLHMPEWIEETYWEQGVEKPLKKSHLVYDQHGNVALEEVYDADGKLAYTISKTYNERGDILTETNRLGQQAAYTYDVRGRSVTATNFSQRLHTILRHDTKGRLKVQIEKGDDGIVHETCAEYDFHDRKIEKRDSFQNTTQYTYDPLVNEITKTDFPPIASIDQQAISVSTLSSYDPFGRQLTKTDANGNTTAYRYNAYGSPVEILHPNGGREEFRYAKNGKLISHTDANGLTIHYKNDVLGRVLSKTYISSDGTTLAQETFTYNGFNLLTETDKEGNLKQYFYDGAGRKIREDFCGHITDFSYDSLGWLALICKQNGDNTLLIHYKRDLEGRLTEECKTDSSGHLLHQVSYSYDKDGNQEKTIRYINGKEAIDSFIYDSFHRQIEYQDAKGYITKTEYNENFINPLGQRTLQKKTKDPHHITTLETQDAFGRSAKVEVQNSKGALIACQDVIHDPQGNLLYRGDHVYENGRFQNIQVVKYTYTPDHQVASITRAFGTKEARTTTYTYFPSGKIATKTLPDGIMLSYNYHPLGFMSHLDSSDGKIHHAFEYDRLGHLKYALDENQNIAISRKVDSFGNVVHELFPNGFEVKKEYDAFNRLITLRMDREGEVHYSYDPLFLRQVRRTSMKGDILYSHAYENYDLDGNLISENLIGNLGLVVHTTDLKGLKASISSPYFSQQCEYDAACNLIHTIVDGAESRYSYDDLSQLSSENGFSQSCMYVHDSLYNRVQKNGKAHRVNELNELLSLENIICAYDLNGNQILKKNPSKSYCFIYDPLNRLIEASSEKQKINFDYDPLGRRLTKVVYSSTAGWKETNREHYLYHGQNEIGAFTASKQPKNLRVLGIAKHKDNPITIGIELEGQFFAPILDVQGNIRRLIDLKTLAITNRADFTAFGEELQTSSQADLFNPWRFASKRFDPELSLIYFGKRYYDPLLGRWLTTDPAGFVDSTNLYQYVFNNPFRYRDPDGQFIIALPLLALTWKVVAVAVVTACVAYELEHQHQRSNSAFARSFNSAVHQVVQNVGGVSQYAVNQLAMGKKQIDARLPNDPDELLNDPNWEETTHPKAKENGHRTFENKATGEKLRYDEGTPGETGHKGESHWHRPNPDSTSKRDKFLDANDNPVPEHSDPSHLYPS